MATKDPFRKAHTQQKSNVRQRGLEMRLTFKELGIPKPTVHWRCSRSWNGWSYADQETFAIA